MWGSLYCTAAPYKNQEGQSWNGARLLSRTLPWTNKGLEDLTADRAAGENGTKNGGRIEGVCSFQQMNGQRKMVWRTTAGPEQIVHMAPRGSVYAPVVIEGQTAAAHSDEKDQFG